MSSQGQEPPKGDEFGKQLYPSHRPDIELREVQTRTELDRAQVRRHIRDGEYFEAGTAILNAQKASLRGQDIWDCITCFALSIHRQKNITGGDVEKLRKDLFEGDAAMISSAFGEKNDPRLEAMFRLVAQHPDRFESEKNRLEFSWGIMRKNG